MSTENTTELEMLCERDGITVRCRRELLEDDSCTERWDVRIHRIHYERGTFSYSATHILEPPVLMSKPPGRGQHARAASLIHKLLHHQTCHGAEYGLIDIRTLRHFFGPLYDEYLRADHVRSAGKEGTP